MKNLLVLLLAFAIAGCASMPPEQKFSKFSTAQLQLRRQQLHEEIPDMIFKFGIFGNDFEKEKKEKRDIEMELLRRYEAGDEKAQLQALPVREKTTVRGGI